MMKKAVKIFIVLSAIVGTATTVRAEGDKGLISGMCLTMKIHFWANMDLRLRDGPFAMQSQQEAMWIVHSLKLYQNLCVSQSCLRS